MIIDKTFITTAKKSRSIVLRFNRDFTDIELHQDNSYSTFIHKNNLHMRNRYGVGYISLYMSQSTPETTAINSLRVNDDIRFYVEDYTTLPLYEAGFQSIAIIMLVKRTSKAGKVSQFEYIMNIETRDKEHADIKIDNSAYFERVRKIA